MDKYELDWALLPEWLRGDRVFLGAEGEGGDEGGSDDAGDSGDEGTEGEGEEEEEESSSDSGDPKDDLTNLKKTLEKERRERKRLERENKRFTREQQTKADSEKSELEQTKGKLTKAEERAQKLAAGFKNNAVDRAIEKIARDLKFRDPSDALAMISRKDIEVDQDEDDPTDVEVDMDSVKTAVKKLAQSKKHLLASGTDDDEPTGSKFGSGNGKTKKKSTEDQYREKYSAL